MYFCLPRPALTPASGCVFAEALAEVCRDAFLNDAAEEAGQRRGDGDQNPKEGREDQARNGYGFQRNGEAVGLAETKMHGEDVSDEFNAADDDGRKEERCNRKGADADEEYVNRAGDL